MDMPPFTPPFDDQPMDMNASFDMSLDDWTEADW
jgi:hypothetical protein